MPRKDARIRWADDDPRTEVLVRIDDCLMSIDEAENHFPPNWNRYDIRDYIAILPLEIL